MNDWRMRDDDTLSAFSVYVFVYTGGGIVTKLARLFVYGNMWSFLYKSRVFLETGEATVHLTLNW